MGRLLLGTVVGMLLCIASMLPASANDEVIRELVASYDVQADGTVDVRWQVDWDFGEPGRRGIIVGLVTREPWENDDELDAVYEVTGLEVDSPTGAPDRFTTRTSRDSGVEFLDVQIGNPDQSLAESRHTYTLSYTVAGTLRTFDGVPELFWDVANDYPPIEQARITVTSPGGVAAARCLVEGRECDASVAGDGVATMQADSIAAGEALSVVAALEPGQVAGAEPVLEDARDHTGGDSDIPGVPGWFSDADRRITNGITGAVVALLVALPRWLAGRGRDERYAAVPPGVMDPDGPVTRSMREGSIPVRFEPPDATLAEAGLALDRTYRSTHLAAVLVEMAVKGALWISTDPLRITRRDPTKHQSPLESALWQHAAAVDDGGSTQSSRLGKMTDAVVDSRPLGERALLRSSKGAWWARILSYLPLLPLAVLAFLIFGGQANPFVVVPLAFSFVPGVVIGLWVGGKLGSLKRPRAPLTAHGSVIREQTEGFQQYLATAEAAQLNFEASQDVFRRYLPWAVLFGLTDRWTQVCQDLARMGRIPTPDVSFVAGATSTRDITRAVTSINAGTRSAQRSRQAASRRSSGYGGGSGGRSGFSSRSRGGGGGGGSRGRSW